METPSISTLAKAAESAYSQTESPTDYTRVEEYSSPDISTYRHNKHSHYIVSHRGTDVHAPTAKKDLKADLRILVGDTSQNKFMKDRTKRTEHIVKQIKEKDPEHKIHLTAHSLGGVSSQTSLIKSKVVRDNVDSHNTFNAGTSPFKMKSLASSNPAHKEIAEKSTHHRISGDGISRNVKTNMIGQTKTYKSKRKPNIAQHILNAVKPIAEKSKLGKLAHFGASRLLGTLQSHSIKNFI